jgi:mRNA interferase MazF
MNRGDVVFAAAPGDYGKPRPALVVQSDLFNETHSSIVICPITSHLIDAPLFRLTLRPTAGNGLATDSQVMVDKIMAVRRERIDRTVGRLTAAELTGVDEALQLWLGLAA